MASRKLVVEIVGDSKSLERSFSRSGKAGKKWQQDMSGVLRPGGAAGLARSNVYGAAALAAGAAVVKFTNDASALEEQLNRTRVVFGSSAADIQAWSQTTARSIGISQAAALQGAANFGTLFTTMGLGKAPASDMSRRLVQLAADMASFNDVDPTQVLDALKSGLVGETEPMRQFGVVINENAVKLEAYRSGIARQGATLTEAQKVQARYNLILAQTATQQGDVARTSGSFANQQRILRAQVADLSTAIGTLLLPAMTNIITTANDVISALGDIKGALDVINGYVASIGVDVNINVIGAEALDALAQIAPGVGPLRDAINALRGRGADKRKPKAPLVMGERGGPAMAAFQPTGVPPPPRPGPSRALRNQWFDARVTREVYRLQGLSNQKQVAGLRLVAKQLQARIKITKDTTRRLKLEDDLIGINREIVSLQEASAAAAAAGAKSTSEAAKAAAEAARVLRETAQFRALGFGPGGADLVPGLPALKNVFARISQAMKSATPKLKSQTKKLMEGIAKILSGGMGDVSEEVRRKIQELLADLDKKLKGGDAKTRQQHFRKVLSAEMLAGLGLSPDQIRILSGRLAGLGSGGKAPTGGIAAFGQRVGPGATVVNINGPIVTNDPDRFVRDMQKRAARSRAQQRGVRPGVNLGGA